MLLNVDSDEVSLMGDTAMRCVAVTETKTEEGYLEDFSVLRRW